MSNRKLAVLGIVAVLMVLWAIVQSTDSIKSTPVTNEPVNLIQGLDPESVGSIVIGKGQETITLVRKDKDFYVKEKDNYPAKAGEINNLITTCLDIKIITSQLYTDDPVNHKELGVATEDARYTVKFLKPDSNSLVGIVVGKNKEQGEGTFVRLLSSDKVYVALSSPWIKDRPEDYIEQNLISLSREDIKAVTVSSQKEKYTLKTDPNGKNIILENPPKGKKLKDNECEQVFTALTSLRFDDVTAKSNNTVKDLDFNRKFVCQMKDSTVYNIEIAQKDNKTYITCDAEFTDKTPVLKEKGVESEEELKKKEAKLLAQEKVKEFSDNNKNWVYQIPDYKAKNLTKELKDLLEDEPKPEEPQEAPVSEKPEETTDK